MEKLGMSGEELDKELNKLIEARLVRAEKFLNTTYYHLHYIRLLLECWIFLIKPYYLIPDVLKRIYHFQKQIFLSLGILVSLIFQ